MSNVTAKMTLWGKKVNVDNLIDGESRLLGEIARIFPNLDAIDHIKIAVIVLGTCSSCHSSGTDCHCWDDE